MVKAEKRHQGADESEASRTMSSGGSSSATPQGWHFSTSLRLSLVKMLASISSLVKAPWPQQGCARFTSVNADVLAVVSGPSESKAARKADPTQGVIEVVAVSSALQEDTKLLESLFKDCLSAEIETLPQPLTVTAVVFSSVCNALSR
jgi:hypothetical protein